MRAEVPLQHPKKYVFPFLFGGTFIEGLGIPQRLRVARYFPSFSEGLSLRVLVDSGVALLAANFPSFSEGLSLRDSAACDRWCRVFGFPFLFGGTFIEGPLCGSLVVCVQDYFPSFSEGLSLRDGRTLRTTDKNGHFPSFSEGLSLRGWQSTYSTRFSARFPFLFGGTFIEGLSLSSQDVFTL